MVRNLSAEQLAYQQSHRDALESVNGMLATFELLGRPESMIDVGCGPGHLVNAATTMGVEAFGLDISLPTSTETLQQWDLAVPYLERSAEMVFCLEVAEHIEVEHENALLNTLIYIADNILVFSAAVPGQGGSGHVNEQTHEYWIEKFSQRGMEYLHPTTRVLQARWRACTPTAWWYSRNMLVFGVRGN